MILNLLEKHYVAGRVDHIDGDARAPEASGASDAVQVRLEVGLPVRHVGQIKVYHNGHLLDVEPPRRHIRCDKHLLERTIDMYEYVRRQTVFFKDSRTFESQ